MDFDVLSKAVQDAGFSVASFVIEARLNRVAVKKDEHIRIGNQYFHFLNAGIQVLDGDVKFSLVDKAFVGSKEFKKYAAMTKMPCIQTGKMAKCCAEESDGSASRIYHVII